MKISMHRLIPALSIAVMSSVFLTGAGVPPQPMTSLVPTRFQGNFRTDRVIARLKSPSKNMIQAAGSLAKAEAQTLDKLRQDEGLSIAKTFSLADSSSATERSQYAVLNIDEARDSVEDVIERLNKNPDVALAQPDYIYRTTVAPNDPSYGSLWGLKNTGQTMTRSHATQSLYTTENPGTSGRDMGLEAAWDKVTDCSNVVVAVLDTGVKLDHDDLKDNLWTNVSGDHGYDFINSDTDPSDDFGHGTHVAGTIGARGNNTLGTTGVCWRVKIMAVKVLDENGTGSTSGIISGIEFATTNGAHIINMSLGGHGSFDSLYNSAVTMAANAGVLLVVAAGNDGSNNGTDPVYPCNFSAANLICVGAVDQSFNRAGFSNYSTSSVHIGAPGTNILSTAMNSWNPTEMTVPMGASDWTTSNPANLAANGTYLRIPGNFDGSTNLYDASVDDHAYQVLDFTGANGAVLSLSVLGSSVDENDYVSFHAANTTGNPTGSAPFSGLYGSTGGATETFYAYFRGCTNTATCSFGIRFRSNATAEDIGYRIGAIKLDMQIISTQGLDSYNGTSMATPHVAGLAALLKAYNPNFTASDLKNAILTKGQAVPGLSPFFKTGAVVNAPSALTYVDPPTGVTATVDP